MLALGPCALDVARRRVGEVSERYDFCGPRQALLTDEQEFEGTLAQVATAADLSIEEARRPLQEYVD